MADGTSDETDGPGEVHRPDLAQEVTDTDVGNNLIQVGNVIFQAPDSGRSIPNAPKERTGGSFLSNPAFLGGLAFAALVAIVIPGALYVRSELQGGSEPTKETPAPSLTVNSAVPGQTKTVPVTKPPVTDASLAVTVDTNPWNMSSPALAEIYGGSEDWLVPKGQIVQGQPDTGKRNDFFYQFAKARNAVSVGMVFFTFNIQNLTGGAVLLRSIQVTDLQCAAPLKGTRIFTGGGAEFKYPGVILIDLDEDRPRPYFLRKERGDLIGKFFFQAAKLTPQQSDPFSFTLSKEETETFDVAARITGRSCQFNLAIEAVVNGQQKRLIISDSGKRFRVTGDRDETRWFFPGGDLNGVPAWGLLQDSQAIPTKLAPVDRPLPETDP
jgi:hypothetical protein